MEAILLILSLAVVAGFTGYWVGYRSGLVLVGSVIREIPDWQHEVQHLAGTVRVLNQDLEEAHTERAYRIRQAEKICHKFLDAQEKTGSMSIRAVQSHTRVTRSQWEQARDWLVSSGVAERRNGEVVYACDSVELAKDRISTWLRDNPADPSFVTPF